MRKALPSLLIALVLGWSGAAIAGYHHSRGMDAYFAGDYAAAFRALRVPAEQGVASAQVWLGVVYEKGMQDYVEAAKWYRLSAEQGNAHAQFNLAYMYLYGKGVIQDIVSAYMWFNISAASGGGAAMILRDNLAEDMTPTQIAEAQKLAREWMEEHQGQ